MCLLNWSDPEDDGGSEIIGFIVERKDAKMHTWRLAVDTDRSKCDITGLIEGQEYKFRVSAKNKFGTGPAVEIGPILAVDPLGKMTHFARFLKRKKFNGRLIRQYFFLSIYTESVFIFQLHGWASTLASLLQSSF